MCVCVCVMQVCKYSTSKCTYDSVCMSGNVGERLLVMSNLL